ncbi:hypothetical protein [Microscilla marina]|uniref:Uncharacterized protein n=1 Tax=Microscilla marina ATCC 23134 TaxID=313606 RepID=A1ZKB8_MICM2|nr:hypothetical protein [Microscilla marina]EAY29144.1 hypothetical protein M23134_02335 [Microscilla marina ATCC 23134]
MNRIYSSLLNAVKQGVACDLSLETCPCGHFKLTPTNAMGYCNIKD